MQHGKLSPTKSPLLSICKHLSSACICEQAMPAPHCALLCPQPSAPAAQGSGCSCTAAAVTMPCHSLPCCLQYWGYILGDGDGVCVGGETCLLVLICELGWTMTIGGGVLRVIYPASGDGCAGRCRYFSLEYNLLITVSSEKHVPA